jgi:hypothetical protein
VTTLVVLDFSGTLSLDMVRFAAPDRIGAELRRSGLEALGIDSPELFWERLVTPTWGEASTTTRGYAEVLTDEVSRVLRAHGRDARADAIQRSVRAFVDRYLACSTIAPQWQGCLRRLADHADAAPVVATDHYAEATARIVAEMARLGVPGAPAGSSGVAAGAVTVANSADLGCHKTSARYWRAVGHALRPSEISRVVLVDDFGANEAPGDVYADATRVQQRHADTIAALTSVFAVAPHVYPFVLPDAATSDDVAGLVAGAEGFTMNILSRPS